MYENLRDLDLLPTKVLNLLVSKGSFAALGFLAGLSLFIEDPRRRAELAMYVLPKGLESAWSAARGKGYVMRTGKPGEALVSGLCYKTLQCAESFSLFRAVGCNWHGDGYGTRFATLNPDSANRCSYPFIFSSLIRGHTSTTRTTCRGSLDVSCINLLAPTNTPHACFGGVIRSSCHCET